MATTKKDNRKLVSMTFRRPWGRYAKGDRAGFEPKRAKELEDRKIATPTVNAKVDEQAEAQKTKPASATAKGTEGADKV